MTLTLHGRLLEYPIFRDISEIKRMRKQCVLGVLSPPFLNAWVRSYLVLYYSSITSS